MSDEYKHSKVMDIDVKEKVTILDIDLVDENKKVTLTFSNNFIHKLAALIVMQETINLPKIHLSNKNNIQNRADNLKQEIKDNYGKALWSDTS